MPKKIYTIGCIYGSFKSLLQKLEISFEAMVYSDRKTNRWMMVIENIYDPWGKQ